MGKTSEPFQKKFRNNSRVDPASITTFLCYYCGKIVTDRVEYQLHMLQVHEVMSQSYQLWSDHTMDSLGLRWSETKGHDDRETSCSLPASPIAREVRSKPSDDDEDYVYEEEKPVKRRNKRDEERAKKTAAERQRKALENQRKQAELAAEKTRKAEEKRQEKAIKDEEKRKASEEKKVLQQQERRRMSTVEPGERVEQPERRKRRKTEGGGASRWRDLQNEGDNSDVKALVTKIFEESKKKEASSLDVEVEELTHENKDRRPFDYSEKATKYCKVCKKGTHYTFASLFEHYQDHHHAVLKSFHYYGFIGKQLIGKKNLLERDYCGRCVLQFRRPRDYFSHMIQYHINESVRCQLDSSFENADNADVEARMIFRDRIITLGYNFKFNEDGRGTPYNDRPGTSASNAFSSTDNSFGDQTMDYSFNNQPSTSSAAAAVYGDNSSYQLDPQVKQEPLDNIKQEPHF